jgi:hypothetical protein
MARYSYQACSTEKFSIPTVWSFASMDASNASYWTGLRPDKSIRGSGQSSANPRGFESGDSNLSKLTDVFAAMQLTETRRESQTGYANPPSNQTKHFRGSEWVLLELATFTRQIICMLAMPLCFYRWGECSLCNQEGSQIRVPAIVFDYPRHSGATDKGMPNRPSIFAYLIFGPGGITVEGITRPMKILAWRGPGT